MLNLVESWTKLLPRLLVGNKGLRHRLVEIHKNLKIKMGVWCHRKRLGEWMKRKKIAIFLIFFSVCVKTTQKYGFNFGKLSKNHCGESPAELFGTTDAI